MVRFALVAIAGIALLMVLMFSALVAGGSAEEAVEETSSTISVATEAPVETTAPAELEHELVVSRPQVGNVVVSPLLIEGTTTISQLGYRLTGGGLPLAEGTIAPDAGGSFSVAVEFSNTCCIEMELEVFDIQPDAGLAVVIPLAYPETS